MAREAMRRQAHKLPIKTRLIKREASEHEGEKNQLRAKSVEDLQAEVNLRTELLKGRFTRRSKAPGARRATSTARSPAC